METETMLATGNITMTKKTLHPDTQWVLDLINRHDEPSKKTELMDDLAELIDRTRGTLYGYLRDTSGKRKFNSEQLVKIAEFFGVDPPESCRTKSSRLLIEESKKLPEAPKIDDDNKVVQLRPAPAGVDAVISPVEGVTFIGFRSPDVVKPPKKSHLTSPRSAKYPDARHMAWEVGEGDRSMEQKTIFPGAYVLCVDFKDTGGKLENDMIVVVERTKAGMVEHSLRAVVVAQDGVWFEPRTNDSDPGIESFPFQSDEGTSVKVLGVLFGLCAGEF